MVTMAQSAANWRNTHTHMGDYRKVDVGSLTRATILVRAVPAYEVGLVFLIMKNFNRHNSHGHHGLKCRELAQHAHSHGPIHSHTLHAYIVFTSR